ncbi:MAG: cobyric acid synthase [Chloroflexota bacterium]|nr:MAG: cobyric acid synthase [Chloroflexota bacterium]
MTGRVLMVQGTASSVGKSILVSALCRIFKQDGLSVAPFKAQNMALNSFVTPEGGEIGRAQAVQADAAGLDPSVDMNPVLLKPEADATSQVIVHGRPLCTLSARDYYQSKLDLWPYVVQSLDRLRARHDLVVIEGAGSPAEINLKERDIVNMRVATYAQAPVLLAGDIDRGGIFAALLGTIELLEPAERALIGGFVVNKFRGDVTLLQPGLDFLEQRTGKPVLGVVPYLRDLGLAEEDSVALDRRVKQGPSPGLLDIAVVRLPHISNFDDFDPLDRGPSRVRYVSIREELGTPDLLIVPGTKSTIADLHFLRQTGLGDAIVALARRKVPVLGICGGYQIIGQRIEDPDGVESDQRAAEGLGLLPVRTTFAAEKTTHQMTGRILVRQGWLGEAHGELVRGYEIHMGQSRQEGADPALQVETRSGRQADHEDGAIAFDGRVGGTYVHGLFHNERITAAVQRYLARQRGISIDEHATGPTRDEAYDRLAQHVRDSLRMDRIYALLDLVPGQCSLPIQT